MIEKIAIRNWQSLRSVDLELGRLTVIVGPSNSGKSAFIRALRAAASNVRGAGHITRGAKSAAVTVHTGEAIVTLERTETSGLYRVVDVTTGEERVFTKLGGSVPEAVTAALRIDPAPTNGASVNFAGQFDRPYLLAESGAAVARELGELTNVNTILSAVGEANKRKNRLAATLRTREADLAALRTQAAAFATLPARLAAYERAERHAEGAARINDQAQRLRRALDTLIVAQGVLARSSVLPEVPRDDAVRAAQDRLGRFRGLVRTWIGANHAVAAATAAVDQAAATEADLHTELHDARAAAGDQPCPTCGRPMQP